MGSVKRCQVLVFVIARSPLCLDNNLKIITHEFFLNDKKKKIAKVDQVFAIFWATAICHLVTLLPCPASVPRFLFYGSPPSSLGRPLFVGRRAVYRRENFHHIFVFINDFWVWPDQILSLWVRNMRHLYTILTAVTSCWWNRSVGHLMLT